MPYALFLLLALVAAARIIVAAPRPDAGNQTKPPRAVEAIPPKALEPAPVRNDVWSVAISPDGKYAAAGAGWWDQPGEVGIWDLTTRKQRRLFREDRGVACVAFSPEGKMLAWSGWSGHVRLCDATSGTEINDLELPGASRIAFSPDGTLLAAAAEAKIVRLWQVASGEVVTDLEGDLFRFHCVAFTPDGKRLLAGGGDWKPGGICQVNVWDVASKKQVLALPSNDRAILVVAASPDSKTFASAGMSGAIHLWDADSGREIKTLRGYTRPVHALAFTPDGATLVSGGEDGVIRTWDVAQGLEKGQVRQPAAAPGSKPEGDAPAPGPPWAIIRSVCVTADGATLVAGGGPKALRLYELASSRETTLPWDSEAIAADDNHGSRLWLLLVLLVIAGAFSGWLLVRRLRPKEAARAR